MGKPRKYSLLLPLVAMLVHTIAALPAWSQPDLSQPTVSRPQTFQAKSQAKAETSIRLIGTAICSNPECSVAVIVDEGNRMQKLYHAGEVYKTLHIKEIHADRIVFDKGNGNQVLRKGYPLSAGTAVTRTTADNKQPPSEPRREYYARQRSYVIDRVRLSTAGQKTENPTDTMLVNESRLLNRKNGFNGQEITTPEDLPTFIRTSQHD